MTNYEEDEKESVINKIIRIVIFTMVAIIIMTSVAVPMFATIGNTTTTLTNSGVNVTDVYEEYQTEISSFDSGTSEIMWNQNGVYLIGERLGAPITYKILDKKDYRSGYPLVIIHPTYGYDNVILEYASSSYNKIISGTSVTSQTQGSHPISQGDKVFVQDPHGSLIMSKDGIYCSDPNNIYGIGYIYNPSNTDNKFIWTSGENATTIEKE